MKKRNIVLKGILLFLVVGVIIGIIYQKNYTFISDETIVSSTAECKLFDQIEVIGNTSIINNLLGAVGTTTIDLTGLATGSEVSHICSDYLVTKYDTTNHWEECSICGSKINIKAHTYSEYWTMGDSCSSSNKLVHTCSCGYSYQSDNTREHELYEGWNHNTRYHVHLCKSCKGEITGWGLHVDTNGNRIYCGNPGTCAVCGREVTNVHECTVQNINGNIRGGTCTNCGKVVADISKTNSSISYNGTTFTVVSNIYLTSTINSSTISIGNASFYVSSMGTITSTQGSYNEATNMITVTFTGKYVAGIENSSQAITQGITFKDTAGSTYWLTVWNYINPENTAPVISNITQTDIATSNGWSTGKNIQVTGTENYCGAVKLEMTDSLGNVYLNDVSIPVTNNNWSYAFTPDIEADANGKTFTITATDTLGNESSKTFTVYKIDKKAPLPTSSTVSSTTWSKTKNMTFTATDAGIGEVQIAFNNINSYGSTNVSGTTYSRPYIFTGDLYGDVKAAVHYKDALGNTTTQFVTISNLDNTAPTITSSDINKNVVSITANDEHTTLGEGSGVVSYRYITSNTKLTNPSIATSNSTEITGKTTGTGTFTINDLGSNRYIYVAAVDAVGNIGTATEITIPSYTVTYDYTTNGGTSCTKTSATLNYGNSVDLTPTATKEGYTFVGWNTSATATTKLDSLTMGMSNITLYAIFSANTYTIKYNGNGATGGSTASSSHTYDVAKNLTTNGYTRAYTITYNHNYTGSTNTSKTATYTFKNWNTVVDGTGTSYNNSASVKNLTQTANGTVNLYAQWTSNSVTYVPTRAGYVFGGWYTDSACTTQLADANGVYTPTANTTLYAKWTAITYTIAYNGNGATGGSTSSSSHTYDVAKNLTANGYERKYTVTYNHNYTGSINTSKTATYSFAGWSMSADGIKVYDNGASIKNLTTTNNGTVNLYAMWNSASVTYVPTRTGYVFEGWYTDAACTNSASSTNGVYTPTTNITLYAKWTAITYTVQYNGNGATGGTTASSSHTYDVEKNLTANGYTRAYTVTYNHNYTGSTNTSKTATYTFKNWNTVVDGTGTSYNNSASVKNLTPTANGTVNLYAQWNTEIVSYVPTRAGYVFVGWYTTAECTGTRVDTSGVYTPTTNTTLYAKWEIDENQTKNLSYTVEYYKDNVKVENDTHTEKITVQLLEPDTLTVNKEAINTVNKYEGYKLDKTEPSSIPDTIATGSTIKVYYAKRTDLSYTVKYLEQDTNKELSAVKTVNSRTYQETVTEQAIEIEGYDKVAPTEKSIQIAVTGNEIIFYYTKRTDLSYTVKYLEKGTNKELAITKTVNNRTYQETVTEQAIEIEGYDKVDPTEKSIQIAVSGNEIIFYYTKRTDLSYTVKYLEKETNKELATTKTVNNRTYQETVIEQAIEIEGYDKVDPTEKSIQIAVTGNEIIFYYTKRTDLSYTVKYLEKETNKELAKTKTVNNRTFQEQVTESAIEINGYDKVDPIEKSIQIAVTGNEIVFYYTKRVDLSYTVKYLEQDSNIELASEKIVENQTFESTATEQAIEIEGYDKVEPTEKSIQIAVTGNEIVFYFTKRTDLSYIVKYLEEDTNIELATTKTVNNRTYQETVTEQAIEIEGYNKVDPTEKSIQIAVTGNEIIFYYTKRTDLSYIVKYLEQDTNVELATAKTVENQTFESTAIESAIEINGYDKVDPTEKSIQIAVTGNEIIFYYTKRTDLSYIVKYLEKETNVELATAKTVENQTFESTAIESAIEIEGYDKVNPTEKSIQIAVSGNEIIFYYTKRTDLSYTVKYLEKETNKELATTKTVNNRTFQEQVTESAIEIEGYDKVDPIEKSIQIEVSGNEIIFYYTKRTDLSYTVKYLEEDTNIELATIKTVSNQTFKSTVTEQAIEINGYDKVDPTEKSIQIEVSGNEIVFYYTKRVDLSYKVNYLLKDNDEDNSNNKILHEQKIVNNQRFKDEIIASDEVIFIYGYKLDSIDKETLVIETTENVINIFYVVDEEQTKELSYTVEYYINDEKQEGDTVVVSQSVQVLKPDTLPMKEELIDNNKYTGYEIDTTKEIPEIVNNGGIVEIHYKNRTFGYKVKYYFNGYVDEALTEEKSAKYLDVIDTYEDKVKIGYKFDVVENLPLTITEKEENNVIKVYYKTDQTVIKEVKYVILYYKDGVIVDSRTVTRKVQVLLPNKVAVDKTLVETDRYEDANFIKTEPAEVPSYVESGDIISVYYESKTSQVTVKYVDKVTGETITEETIEGKVGDTYSIEAKEIEGYTLIESPELTGTYTEEAQEKIFYYAKNAEVKAKYLEKDTGEELADEETITGYEGKEYSTEAKEIENYELVETIGVSSGTMTAGNQEVIYYYAQKTKVIVNHIDVISNEILETEAIEGKVGDEYSTTSKDFEGYVLEEKPEQENGTMTKDEIVLNYYYKHVSEGVIVKHIDKISGEILDNETIEGNEGDSYETSSKEFDSYALDETLLPENASGNMTKELIEVKYYYVRKTQVKVEYLDRNTNEELIPSELLEGHEGDSYTTTPKEIEEYYLVESMLPTNAEGTMTKEKIIVTYYYAKKSTGVLEKHINEKTGEVIEEKLHEGLIGDDYKISSKEFENYDLDTTKLPENSQGKMTEELIEVDYYYIRKAQVKVEYIDELTNEVIEQNIITGHEGDTYKTSPKEINNYILDEENLPENVEGIMEIIVSEDGTINTEIVVKYYYKKISAGVLEKHIDIKTDDVLEEEFHSGNVGDTYKIDSKTYEEYDLIEKDEEGNSKLPENSEGTMKEEQIEVDYYYIRKSTVRVEYVDNETGKKISEDRIIEGHEDDEYKTEPKEIKNYTLNKDKLPENAEGTMKVVRSEYFVDEVKTETVVTYYYDKVKNTDDNKDNNDSNNTKPDSKPSDNSGNTGNSNNNSSNNNQTNNSNSNGKTQTIIISTDNSNASSTNTNNTSSTTQNNKTTMPSTGDIMPVIAVASIILVAIVNLVQIIISKRNRKK